MSDEETYEVLGVNLTGAVTAMEHWVPMSGEGQERAEIHIGITFSWSAKDIGFGELHIRQLEEGPVHLYTETMTKEFAKAVICKWIDEGVIVDGQG